ncbi:MAG: hypothetical protein AAGG46_05485 [Planctomycetota bacterium]
MPPQIPHRCVLLLAAGWLAVSDDCLAGGGPENVFLVYNRDSADSAALADFYAGIRKVPRGNLFGLDWRGSRSQVTVKQFRSEILRPILEEIGRRRLGAQIDYVVYSCDFPWKIALEGDFEDTKLNKSSYPFASLTGATYLHRFVFGKSVAILGLRTNWYVPGGTNNLGVCSKIGPTPSRGFRATTVWRPDGGNAPATPAEPNAEANPKPGLTYLLSTMLAVTDGRGNSLAEAKRYLKAAAQADAAPPTGTFYFVRNSDVRSTCRHQCYEAVATAIRALGAKAEVLSGAFPSDIDDALGIVSGTRSFNLVESRVRMLPGSIGDNLTSYGGVMTKKSSQTPLSHYLRAGAAAASGTVFEPTALQAKFPLPTLMLHYRRGCSLAEAFYQSVAAPYQLLIVGDPLCQPWAERPRVTVPGLQEGQLLSDTVVVRPAIRPPSRGGVQSWDLYLDGRLGARAPPGAGVRFNPRDLKPGQHEVRVVARAAGPIESQGRWIANFVVPQPQTDEEREEKPSLKERKPAVDREVDESVKSAGSASNERPPPAPEP